MLCKYCHNMVRRQSGYTLLEVIAVLLVTGLIGIGATTATVQVLTQGTRNSEYTTVSRNASDALFWISRDAQMTQNVTSQGGNGFPLTLRWTEWDNSQHEVVYSLVDQSLNRSSTIDGGEPTEILVAHYINSVADNTTCVISGGVIAVTVTATIGEGNHIISVTKIRQITPRPSL